MILPFVCMLGKNYVKCRVCLVLAGTFVNEFFWLTFCRVWRFLCVRYASYRICLPGRLMRSNDSHSLFLIGKWWMFFQKWFGLIGRGPAKARTRNCFFVRQSSSFHRSRICVFTYSALDFCCVSCVSCSCWWCWCQHCRQAT